MPVRRVKPSITDWGTYSDQANRLSSCLDPRFDVQLQPPTATRQIAATIAMPRMPVACILGTSSARAPPQELGRQDKAHRRGDEDGRDRVERRIEALLDAAEDLQGQRAGPGAGDEIGDDQLVERE